MRKFIGTVIGIALLVLGIGSTWYGNAGFGLICIGLGIVVVLLSWLTGRGRKHPQIE